MQKDQHRDWARWYLGGYTVEIRKVIIREDPKTDDSQASNCKGEPLKIPACQRGKNCLAGIPTRYDKISPVTLKTGLILAVIADLIG